MKKKLLTVLIALALILSAIPSGKAFAATKPNSPSLPSNSSSNNGNCKFDGTAGYITAQALSYYDPSQRDLSGGLFDVTQACLEP